MKIQMQILKNITEGEGGSITNPDLIAEANSEE